MTVEPLDGHSVAGLEEDDLGFTLTCECDRRFVRSSAIKCREAHASHVGILRARRALDGAA